MIDRLEVTPGPGTVIRFGHVAAWASATASPALISFLVESARNLATSARAGQQLADHLSRVLDSRDPEPHVPFVTVGPSPDGWAALLHGPVQAWDGIRWITTDPHPGWLRCPLWPRPSIAVTISGAPAPLVSPDSLANLEAGVVPGGGFVLVPATAVTAPTAAEQPEPTLVGATSLAHAETATEVALHSSPATAPEGQRTPDSTVAHGPLRGEGATVLTPAAGGTTGDGGAESEQDPAGEEAPGAATMEPAGPRDGAPGAGAPAGVVDLRSPKVLSSRVAYPPLPTDGGPRRSVPGAPVVAGVLCNRGHLNRPGMAVCFRCHGPIAVDGSYNVSGTRPGLGCLIIDDGSVYRLDSGYLAGSDPGADPTVRGRLARPLVLSGTDVAASHAEIRLHDWDVVITDRASEGGTHVFEPGATEWERLRPYQPRTLRAGTHVALGQRVLTFVTPWTTHENQASEGGPSSRA